MTCCNYNRAVSTLGISNELKKTSFELTGIILLFIYTIDINYRAVF